MKLDNHLHPVWVHDTATQIRSEAWMIQLPLELQEQVRNTLREAAETAYEAGDQVMALYWVRVGPWV